MNRAIKYRLYPTTEQRIMFVKTFGCCRKVYNLMLADKITCYKETKSFGKQTPAMYKKDYPFLTEVDSLALANVQLNLQRAINNCFSKSRKKKNGFSKFKSAKHSRKSYTTNNLKGSVTIVDGKYIKLPKYGKIKTKIHRSPLPDWKVKSATVSQDSDGKFYVSVLFEYDNEFPLHTPDKNKVLGLDYSTSSLYVDSNSVSADMPKMYKKSHAKLAGQQRKLRNKVLRSNNYIKQQRKIAKLHKHISNQRNDFLHKTSTAITKQYDVVAIEDISITEQLHNRKFKNFRKSTLDNGWYNFTQMLKYKLSDNGKRLIVVDKAFPSSKKCSHCGYVNSDINTDGIRKWICPVCGVKHNRDINAAINIKNEAIRIVFG